MKVRITEYLDVDLERELWCCNRCTHALGPARENWKHGCLVDERPLAEVHPPLVQDGEFTFAYDPNYTRLIEFYCPACGIMIENEYLPPGHPLTHDIELDIDALKAKHSGRGA